MEKLDYLTRTQKERYREWAHEYVNQNEYELVCPEASRFIAKSLQDAKTKPVSVQLVRHWAWIQPPAGFAAALPPGEFEHTFFVYDVKPEDLK